MTQLRSLWARITRALARRPRAADYLLIEIHAITADSNKRLAAVMQQLERHAERVH